MGESGGWTVNGEEWTVFATLAEQDATPIIHAKTVRAGLSQDKRGRGSGLRTRRVHPDEMRGMVGSGLGMYPRIKGR
jgi:hypothetical protein